MTQRQLPMPTTDSVAPLSTGGNGRGGARPGQYRYLAYSPSRAIEEGVIKAASLSDAEATLVKAGYQPLVVRRVRQMPFLKELFRSKRVKLQDVVILTEQLAVLLRSGVPLVTSLESLRGQFRNIEFREALDAITEAVRGGTPLSEAMDKYPHIFSKFYIQMIVMGERSGDIEGLLEQASAYFRRELGLRQMIRRALFYPMMVLVLALVVVVVLLKFVLPKVLVMFEVLDVPLPLISRITLGTGKFINDNQLVLAVGFLLIVLGLFLGLRLPRTKLYLHRTVLRLPLLKAMVIYRELGRFSRLCGLMLHNGLPLPNILTMVASIAGNLEVRRALQATQAEVSAGQTLSSSLLRESFIPPMFMQMVQTGEISGNLEGNLMAIANFYDRELDSTVEASIAMLEPILTIVVGAVILFVALTIIVPIYSIIGSVGG